MIRLRLSAFFRFIFGLALLLRRQPSARRALPLRVASDDDRFAALASLVEVKRSRRELSSGKSGPAFAPRCPHCAARGEGAPLGDHSRAGRVVHLFGPRGDA